MAIERELTCWENFALFDTPRSRLGAQSGAGNYRPRGDKFLHGDFGHHSRNGCSGRALMSFWHWPCGDERINEFIRPAVDQRFCPAVSRFVSDRSIHQEHVMFLEFDALAFVAEPLAVGNTGVQRCGEQRQIAKPVNMSIT